MEGKRNISRRELLLGALGATGLTAGGAAFLHSRKNPEISIEEVIGHIPESARELAARQPVSELIEQVKTAYPEQLSRSLRDIFVNPTYNEDPRILEILRRGTLAELRGAGLFHSMDTPFRRNFQNPHELPNGMWDEKCEKTRNGDYRDTQLSVCEAARNNTSRDSLPARPITSQQFFETIRVGLDTARVTYPDRPMTGKLAQALIPETLLAITTHELMPGSENPMWRIALYRALLDNGFEPNRIPAMSDTILSFGLFQMTQMTYENGYHGIDETPDLSRRSGGSIGYLTDDAQLPSRLHECVTIDDQTLAGALLQFENIYTYIAPIFADNPILETYWDTMSTTEKQSTLAALLGATHHSPARASHTLRILSQHLSWRPTTQPLRSLYIHILRQRPEDESDDTYEARLETVEHAINTSALITAWQDYLDTD